MYKVGDYLVYKKDVCKVVNIIDNILDNVKYYVLSPIDDESLKVDVPVDNRCGFIRNLISREELEDIIDDIPNVKVIENSDRLIEGTYKELLKNGTHRSLISIIKTTYLRNQNRKNSKKKLSEKDEYYFNKAEKYLYTEFGIVLGMNYEDTKEYVISRVSKLGSV